MPASRIGHADRIAARTVLAEVMSSAPVTMRTADTTTIAPRTTNQ
jgi:hypothetical protein